MCQRCLARCTFKEVFKTLEEIHKGTIRASRKINLICVSEARHGTLLLILFPLQHVTTIRVHTLFVVQIYSRCACGIMQVQTALNVVEQSLDDTLELDIDRNQASVFVHAGNQHMLTAATITNALIKLCSVIMVQRCAFTYTWIYITSSYL